MYYEITLNWMSDGFHVGEKGQGWAMDSDLLHEAAMGYPVEEIGEAELPATLHNPTYPGLRVFRMDGQNGPSYFGVYEGGRCGRPPDAR